MRLFLKRSTPPLDAGAFAQLYQAHLAAVFNYCLFRVGDRPLAEDLAADAFERAWRARDRYRPERGDFAAWVIAIARNAVIDWQRRNHRRPTVALPELPDYANQAAYSIKVSRYLSTEVTKGLAISDQPVEQYYWHRPLHLLLNSAFAAGLVMDRLEEPVLAAEGPATGPFNWANYDMPPLLFVRLRRPGL